MRTQIYTLKAAFLAVALLAASAQSDVFAAEDAAEVAQLRGIVEAVDTEGRKRVLQKGDTLFQGDRVDTGERAAVKIRFTDGSRFELGSNASLQVDQYAYTAESPRNTFRTRVVKGVFRFFTGLIAKHKPNNVAVQLSVATIGIRGTHVVGEVEQTSARVILMEPEDEGRKSAIQVANDFGSVVIDEPGFGTEIPDEHSPPSPPRRMRLQTINNLMRSFQSIQRISTPRPRMMR